MKNARDPSEVNENNQVMKDHGEDMVHMAMTT